MRVVTICVLLCLSAATACSNIGEPKVTLDAGVDAGQKLRTVELVRDRLGVMHVYGSDDQAALYGQGYALATDRLFQIELTRRQALGQQAEVLGEKAFDSDVASRALNFAKLGVLDLTLARANDSESVDLAQAWVEGVNARIAEVESGQVPKPYGLSPKELDLLPEPWTLEHVFAVGKMLTFGMSSSLEYEILASALRKLGADFYNQVPISQPTYDVFPMVDYKAGQKANPRTQPKTRAPSRLPQGMTYKHRFFFGRPQSNNWAVAGSLTDTATPFVCGDPHQPLDSPPRFWPVHLNSKDAGGSLDVVGFAFAGTPGVQLGHTAGVAWTATTNHADVMDLFEVQVVDATSIEIGEASFPIRQRKEAISVRAEDGKVAKRTVTFRDVPNQGILLPEEMLPVPTLFLVDNPKSDAILLKWTGFSASSEFAAYANMAKANNVDEWERAVDELDVGAVNLVAADKEHIVYHVHADVPDRGSPSALPMPWRVLPVEHAPALWGNGLLGADRLPHLKDPQGGLLSTANNDPWGFTADGDTSNDAFYYGNFYARGFRAHRINKRLSELVASGHKLTREHMHELQRDVFSSMAETMIPKLIEALAATEGTPELVELQGDADLINAVNALSAWDKRFTRDSGAAVMFLALEWYAVRDAFADKLGAQLFDPIASADPPYLLGMLRNTLELRYVGAEGLMLGGRDAFLLRSLRAATGWIRQRFGSLDVSTFKLSDVHAAQFDNRYGKRFDGGLTAVHGSADTVNVSAAAFFENGVPRSMFVSGDGALYRMVVGFGADGVPEATINFARGTSEDPDSSHFADQQESWADVTYQKLPFRKQDVEAAAESRRMLTIPNYR